MSDSILTSIFQLLKPELVKISKTFFENLPNDSEEALFKYLKRFQFSNDYFNKLLNKSASIASGTPFISYKMIFATFPLLQPEDTINLRTLFEQSFICTVTEKELSNKFSKHGLSFLYYSFYSEFILKLSKCINKKADEISSLFELIAEFCLQEFSSEIDEKILLLLITNWSNAASNLSLHCNDNIVYERMRTYFSNSNLLNKNVGYLFFENVEYNNLPSETSHFKLLNFFSDQICRSITLKHCKNVEILSSFLYNLLGQWFFKLNNNEGIKNDNNDITALNKSPFIQILFRNLSDYVSTEKENGENINISKSLHLLVLLACFADSEYLKYDPSQFSTHYLFNLPNINEGIDMNSILSSLKICIRGKNFASKFRKKKDFRIIFNEWKYSEASPNNSGDGNNVVKIIFDHFIKNILIFSKNQKKLTHFFIQISAFSIDFWVDTCMPMLMKPEVNVFCKDSIADTFIMIFKICNENTKNEKILNSAKYFLFMALKTMKIKPESISNVYNIFNFTDGSFFNCTSNIENQVLNHNMNDLSMENDLNSLSNDIYFLEEKVTDFRRFLNISKEEEWPFISKNITSNNDNDENSYLSKLINSNVKENVDSNSFPQFVYDFNVTQRFDKIAIFEVASHYHDSAEIVGELCQLLFNGKASIAISSALTLEEMIMKKNDNLEIVLNFLLDSFDKYNFKAPTHFICLSAIVYFVDIAKKESIKITNKDKFCQIMIISICSKFIEIRILSLELINKLNSNFTKFLKEKDREISEEAMKNISIFARSDINISKSHINLLKLDEIIQTNFDTLIMFFLSSLGKILSKNPTFSSLVLDILNRQSKFLKENKNIFSLLLPMIDSKQNEDKLSIFHENFEELFLIYSQQLNIEAAATFSCASTEHVHYLLELMFNRNEKEKNSEILPQEFKILFYILRMKVNDISISNEMFEFFVEQYKKFLFSTNVVSKTSYFSVDVGKIKENRNSLFNFSFFLNKTMKKVQRNKLCGYFGYEPINEIVYKNKEISTDDLFLWLNLSSYTSSDPSFRKLSINISEQIKTRSSRIGKSFGKGDLNGKSKTKDGNNNEDDNDEDKSIIDSLMLSSNGYFHFKPENLPVRKLPLMFRKTFCQILSLYKIPNTELPPKTTISRNNDDKDNKKEDNELNKIISKIPVFYKSNDFSGISKIIFTQYFNDNLLELCRTHISYFCGFINLFDSSLNHNEFSDEMNSFDKFILSNIGRILALCFYYFTTVDNFQVKVTIYRTLRTLTKRFDISSAFEFNPEEVLDVSEHLSKIFQFCGEQFISECLALKFSKVLKNWVNLEGFSFNKFGVINGTLPYFQEFSIFSLVKDIIILISSKNENFSKEISEIIDIFVDTTNESFLNDANNSNDSCNNISDFSYGNEFLTFLIQLILYIKKPYRTLYAYLYSKNPSTVLKIFVPFLHVSLWHFCEFNKVDYEKIITFLFSILIDFAREDFENFRQYYQLVHTFCLLHKERNSASLILLGILAENNKHSKYFNNNKKNNLTEDIISPKETKSDNDNNPENNEEIFNVDEYLFSWAFVCGDLSYSLNAISLLIDNKYVIKDENHLKVVLRTLYIISRTLYEETNNVSDFESNSKGQNTNNRKGVNKESYTRNKQNSIIIINNEKEVGNNMDEDQVNETIFKRINSTNFSVKDCLIDIISYISKCIELLSNCETSLLLCQEVFDFVICFLSYQMYDQLLESVLEFILIVLRKQKALSKNRSKIIFSNIVEEIIEKHFNASSTSIVFDIIFELIEQESVDDEYFPTFVIIPKLFELNTTINVTQDNEIETKDEDIKVLINSYKNQKIKNTIIRFFKEKENIIPSSSKTTKTDKPVDSQTKTNDSYKCLLNCYYSLVSFLDTNKAAVLFDFYERIVRNEGLKYSNFISKTVEASYYLSGFLLNSKLILSDSPNIGSFAREATKCNLGGNSNSSSVNILSSNNTLSSNCNNNYNNSSLPFKNGSTFVNDVISATSSSECINFFLKTVVQICHIKIPQIIINSAAKVVFPNLENKLKKHFLNIDDDFTLIFSGDFNILEFNFEKVGCFPLFYLEEFRFVDTPIMKMIFDVNSKISTRPFSHWRSIIKENQKLQNMKHNEDELLHEISDLLKNK